MTACVFCAIISGSTSAQIVAERPDAVAFLDARPVFKGHVLVVPRLHIPTLPELATEVIGEFFGFVQQVTAAVESGLDAGGTFVALNNKVSQSVPHLHVHVVPRTKGDGLRGFFWPRTRYASEEEAAGFAARITAAMPAPRPAPTPGS